MRIEVPLAAALALSLAISLTAQGRLGTSSGGSYVISPAVVATALFANGSGDDAELQVLVLWRGSPGWFLDGDHSGSSTRSDSRTMSRDTRGGPILHEFYFGNRRLRVRLDPRSETAEIGETVISLRDGRAVLVDEVDDAGGPRVIGTRLIGTQASGVPPRIEPLLRESPELVAFLRCDQRVADSRIPIQTMVAATCREILGR